MSANATARLALGAFLLGAALMLALDHAVTRIAGVALLFAGIGLGVFAIATDVFVAGNE